MSAALQGAYLFALAHLLARVEIHVEGDCGWAAKLPTWRWGPEWWLRLTNGKELTGYHVWLTLFLVGVLHLPLVLAGFSRPLLARCLSSYLAIVAVWDLQWFVWNPAWGLSGLRSRPVPWFRAKWLGFPTDYYFALSMSALAVFLIDRPGLPAWGARTGAMLLLSALSFAAAPRPRA
jgi:hypothetical protein